MSGRLNVHQLAGCVALWRGSDRTLPLGVPTYTRTELVEALERMGAPVSDKLTRWATTCDAIVGGDR